MFEGVMAGGPPGGQLTMTTEIENFPGFPEGITGLDLMTKMKEQFQKYSNRILSEDVVNIDLSQRPFRIQGNSTVVETESVIIATGATARRLGLPAEARLWNRGISACAVCDGGLPIFRNKELVVVGGGDTAIEEAIYLTNFASKVYLIHRRDKLRASHSMQERLLKNEKVTVLWNSRLEDIKGDKKVEAAVVFNVVTNQIREYPVAGIFYAIGHTPNTGFLNQQLPVDEAGYLTTVPGTTLTPIQGVFACGDVQDSRYRQAISAAGSGCMAALDCQRFLEGLEG